MILGRSLIALGFTLAFALAGGSAHAKRVYTEAEMQALLANGLIISSTHIRNGESFTARLTLAASGELSGVWRAGAEAIPVSGSWKLKGNELCRTLGPVEPDEVCEKWFKAGRNRATVSVGRKIVGFNKW